MSLIGDALSHAVLPGAAIGFMVAGLSLVSMSIGGFIAGIFVALLSGFVTRLTKQREDASFAAFYLISLAIGVLIISIHGSNVDIMHVLFGTILAIDNESLFLVVSITSLTLLTFAIVGRGLVVESFDPGFLKAVGGSGTSLHLIFLILVVLNLVAGFHALGTLMAVGLMMLPAVAARFWASTIIKLAFYSIIFAFISLCMVREPPDADQNKPSCEKFIKLVKKAIKTIFTSRERKGHARSSTIRRRKYGSNFRNENR